jgi:hypothetical protein
LKTSHSTTKYSRACHTDIPGPTTQAGTGSATMWAPGTTRLVPHGGCQCQSYISSNLHRGTHRRVDSAGTRRYGWRHVTRDLYRFG